MKFLQSICIPVVLPAVVSSAAIAALSHWMTGGLTVAVYVATACLTSMIGTSVLIARSRREAVARLRRPELCGGSLAGSGVFRDVLSEALNVVGHSEAQSRAASKSKAELEARSRVRRLETHRWDKTLHALEIPVLITDARGRITFCNTSAQDLLLAVARQSGAALGDDAPDLSLLPALQQLISETLERNAATDRRVTQFDLPSGGVYRATAQVIHDESDSVLGLAAILTDIRDEQLANTRHAEFVSSVSHELKTPMASIKAFLEMLSDGDVTDPDEQQELFGFMEAQIDRLTRMVNSMLNLARIESGVIDIQRADCNLNDTLQKALDVVEPVAEEKHIRVISELSDLYLATHIDTDLFGQAIINLLSNAAKYTPEGGELRLRSRMLDSQAVIEVSDTGMGIPSDSLPHIFDRFYRVPENNQAAAGTGLGLALVHYVITDVHNGTIEVESEIDQGTKFRITIPLGHKDRARKQPELAMSAV